MSKKIVIAGGTGFVGNFLTSKFKEDGFDVCVISRNSNVRWSDKPALLSALEGSDTLINLAGKSVNCRYNEKNRALILSSRLETTKLLGEAIQQCVNPPKLWMNASAATIYRDELTRPNTEFDITDGDGFSVEVSKQWEQAFYSFTLEKTRQIAMRISIVLGENGGVIPVYKNLVKFGLGGRQGDGQQKFSWIHIDDFYRIIRHAQESKEINGPLNFASPHPISNERLMSEFRKAMGVKFGLNATKWMLGIGALLIGTEPELILRNRWVVSQKLIDSKFKFQFPTIEDALANLV
jgi:uncharacterized protein (TIGR01777 family)